MSGHAISTANARALARRAMRPVSLRRQVRRLARSPEPAVQRLADGLRDAAADHFDLPTRSRFARIEALRDELSASTERVEVHDFGAGLPTSTRTAVEMVRGTVSSPAVGRLAATASLPPQLGRLLHAVVAATGARRGIELGTCLGISAAYQAAALEDRDGAEFVTCEGAPALAALAERNLARLGLRRCRVVTGRFGDTLPELAAGLAPLDYAFVDGHHDERATIDYFELLRPSLATGAVVVFDDIRWSPGMERAWAAIRAAPGLLAHAELGRFGVVVTGPGR